MARKREKPFYEKVRIENIGSEGKAMVRINNMVVFTKFVVPGDVVDLQVIKKRKNYQEAIVTRIHEYSDDRVKAFCRHFGQCGGCKWQLLPYNKQLFYKEKQVEDQLTRIGKLQLQGVLPILGSEKNTFYRNKLEFTFSNKRWLSQQEIESGKNFSNSDSLGFHVHGRFDKVINIEKCWLQPYPSNEIRNFIYGYGLQNRLDFFDIREQEGFLRTLIIRTSSIGETMVILSFFRDDRYLIKKLLQAVRNEFPLVTSLMYVINTKGNDTITDLEIKLFDGRGYIIEEMEGSKFKVGPKSFYQTNSDQACKLYKTVRDLAGLTGNETVYDLYTGTGTIANFIAGKAKKVIGIECIPEAITNAKENASFNKINNAFFYTGDINNILTRGFIEKQGLPDTIITDPPRAGMHKDVLNTLLDIRPRKILYVSCNPATQSRDISLLSKQYKITVVQPIDMFPHTHHVENVVLLEKI